MDRDSLAEAVMLVIKRRRSTRRFLDKKIPKSVLLQLIEAGICAPSGSNWQNQRFLILEDKDEIERLGRVRFVWPYKKVDSSSKTLQRLHPTGIIGKAAAVIVVFADSLQSDYRDIGEYYIWQNLEIQNCSAAIQNILLLSSSMRIGSCWVSASEEMNYTRLLSRKTWRKLFADYAIPSHYKIQGVVLLGYPEHVDEEGFPRGEKKHGATIWQTVERKPVDEYLIRKRKPADKGSGPINKLDVVMLKIAARLLRLLLKLVRGLDRLIRRIEVKYVARIP